MGKSLTALLFAAVLTGSASCERVTPTPRNIQLKAEVIIQHSEIVSAGDISISLEPPKQTGVEGLIETTDNYLEYIEFRKKYSDDAVRITNIIKNCSERRNNLSTLDRQVRDLGRILQKDENPYAQQYFETIKNFEYVRRDYYSADVGEIWEKSRVTSESSYYEKSTFNYYSGNEEFIEPMIEKLRKKGFEMSPIVVYYYDEIRVRPYTGEEEILKERVKVE
ncbi:MAG: hypothetical protein ABIH72_02570 [archaeon]